MAFRIGSSAIYGKSAVIGASVAMLLLAACGKKDGDRPVGQVIAHVGSDDVTIQELDNELRLANVPADKRDDGIVRKALLAIVTRKAVARQAMTAKLDREPTTQLDILRDKEQILARTFLQRTLSNTVAGIGQSDVDQYISAHPGQFAKRVIFVTDQIEIPAQFVTPAVGAATKDAKTLAEVEQKLRGLNVSYQRAFGSLDSSRLPDAMTQQLQSQKVDNVFFSRIGGGGIFFTVAETQSKPLTGSEASGLAREMIAGEKFGKLNRQAETDARNSATFEGDYAKIMSDPSPKK